MQESKRKISEIFMNLIITVVGLLLFFYWGLN